MPRPRKLTKARRKAFCQAYAGSGNFTQACEQTGVSVWTVRRALNPDHELYMPEFALEVEAAEDDLGDRMLTTVMRYAVEGVPYQKEKFDAKGNLKERESGTKISPQLAWQLAQRFSRAIRTGPAPRLDLTVAAPDGGPVRVSKAGEWSAEAIALAERLSYEELCELRDHERRIAEIRERAMADASGEQ